MQEQTVAAPAVGQPSDKPVDEHGHQLSRLGPLLCWAVVFADIGTSVYYTPGILLGTVGVHAALFVLMTTAVFILLTLKYAEVTVRYPEGGGVVTVGARAIHPFVGLVGGMFILVDYFLTAALSALSGVIYLSVVLPALHPALVQLVATVAALAILGLLNWVGISESAKVSAIFAIMALVGQLSVVIAVMIHLGLANVLGTFPKMLGGPKLTPLTVLTGYAGAFLAFSGLESISQLSPVMATPRRIVARRALGLVVITMCLTSPLLTLWSTTLLNAQKDDPNQFISLLGGFSAGQVLQVSVAITGSLLLIFASNTAIIGTYHVFLALSRMRFFPEVIGHRNRLRGTPHWAILLATGIPITVLLLANGSVSLLGDLYAFGLLGAFSLTSLSLDVVRLRERRAAHRGVQIAAPVKKDERHGKEDDVPRVNGVLLVLGMATTVLVALAWTTNLFSKPQATFFGGGVSTIGMIVVLINYARLNRQGMAVAFPSSVRAALQDAVMVLLPSQLDHYDELLRTAASAADGRPVVFLYRGTRGRKERRPGIFEVVDPYLDDRAAKDAFGRAERIARRLGLDRRFVYVPAGDQDETVTRIWQTIRPRDTLAAVGDDAELHELGVDRIRRSAGKGQTIVHYLKHW